MYYIPLRSCCGHVCIEQKKKIGISYTKKKSPPFTIRQTGDTTVAQQQQKPRNNLVQKDNSNVYNSSK